jgi:hypothetical protein
MSKRSERRAAARAEHKANRIQNPAAARPITSQPAEAEHTLTAVASAGADSSADPFQALYEFIGKQDLGWDDDSAHPAQAPLEQSRPQQAPKSTASEAQIKANPENSKHSTGPRSVQGRAIVSYNHRTHGLIGRFMLLPDEKSGDYELLVRTIYDEHNPQTDTEFRLANSVIQHYWLMQRAIRLQEELIHDMYDSPGQDVDSKKLALFMRYQATHERSYYRAQKELIHLQKQRQKEAIGFESQKRQQEAHEARLRLTHAKAQNLEIDTACRQVMEAPIPGNTKIGFEQLTHACSTAIATVVYENQFKKEEDPR